MNENDLRDFDFYNEYAYTYCARHLEGDGWSKQEWKNATELYKKKLKALEIIKENFVFLEPAWIAVDSDEMAYGSFTQNKHLTKEEYDLLKEVGL